MKKIFAVIVVMLCVLPLSAQGWVDKGEYWEVQLPVNGEYLFSRTRDTLYVLEDTLKAWDLRTGELVGIYPVRELKPLIDERCFVISNDGKTAVFLHYVDAIQIETTIINLDNMTVKYDTLITFSRLDNYSTWFKRGHQQIKCLSGTDSALISIRELANCANSDNTFDRSVIISWHDSLCIYHLNEMYTKDMVKADNEGYFYFGGNLYRYSSGYNSDYHENSILNFTNKNFEKQHQLYKSEFWIETGNEYHEDNQYQYQNVLKIIHRPNTDYCYALVRNMLMPDGSRTFGMLKTNKVDSLRQAKVEVPGSEDILGMAFAKNNRFLLLGYNKATAYYDCKYDRLSGTLMYNKSDTPDDQIFDAKAIKMLAYEDACVVLGYSQSKGLHLRKYYPDCVKQDYFDARFSLDKKLLMQYDSLRAYETLTTEADSYSFDWGDGSSTNALSAAHQYTNSGTYTVKLTVIKDGQTDTSEQTIEVRPYLEARIDLEYTELVVPKSIHLKSNSSGDIGEYIWYKDSVEYGRGAELDMSFTEPGYHDIMLEVSDGPFSSSVELNEIVYARRDTLEGKLTIRYETLLDGSDGAYLQLTDTNVVLYSSFQLFIEQNSGEQHIDVFQQISNYDYYFSKQSTAFDSVTHDFRCPPELDYKNEYKTTMFVKNGSDHYCYLDTDWDISFYYKKFVTYNSESCSTYYAGGSPSFDYYYSPYWKFMDAYLEVNKIVILSDKNRITSDGVMFWGDTVRSVQIEGRDANHILAISSDSAITLMEFTGIGQVIDSVRLEKPGYIFQEMYTEDKQIIVLGHHDGKANICCFDYDFNLLWEYEYSAAGTEYLSAVKISDDEYAVTGDFNSNLKFHIVHRNEGIIDEYEIPEGPGYCYQICNSYEGGLFLAGRIDSSQALYGAFLELPGRTLFEFSVEDPAEALKDRNILIYPNPAGHAMKVAFEMERGGEAVIKIYDMQGNLCLTVITEDLAPGLHTVPIRTSGLSAGAYILELKGEGKISTENFIINRRD